MEFHSYLNELQAIQQTKGCYICKP